MEACVDDSIIGRIMTKTGTGIIDYRTAYKRIWSSLYSPTMIPACSHRSAQSSRH